MIQMEYVPTIGDNIEHACREMVDLANSIGTTVVAKFNNQILRATKDSDPAAMVAEYHAESDRRRQEYLRSDAYREAKRIAGEQQRERDRALAEALADNAATFTIIDQDKWSAGVEKNADEYGAGIYRYAEKWARVMESRIARGETVEACATDASRIADDEGITGFMYGCAVSILAQCWLHGEALRKWHNRDVQVGAEGDRANESGGVLNPALLVVGEVRR